MTTFSASSAPVAGALGLLLAWAAPAPSSAAPTEDDAPPTYEVSISTRPDGASIYIDGSRQADASPLDVRLRAGKHKVKAQWPGSCGSQTITRTVDAETSSLWLTAKRKVSWDGPRGAAVKTANRKPLGKVGGKPELVPVGSNTLIVIYRGSTEEHTVKVDVPADCTRRVVAVDVTPDD